MQTHLAPHLLSIGRTNLLKYGGAKNEEVYDSNGHRGAGHDPFGDELRSARSVSPIEFAIKFGGAERATDQPRTARNAAERAIPGFVYFHAK
jgi:hypothetical protein